MKFYLEMGLVVLSMCLLVFCGEELGPPMQLSDGGFLQEEDASIFEQNDAANVLPEDTPNIEAEVPDASEEESGEFLDPVDAGQVPDLDDAAIIVPDDPEPEDPLAWVPECQTQPCPNIIDHFPYVHSGDTRNGASQLDAYSCQPGTSEAGPEELFVFRLTEAGVIIIGLTEPSGEMLTFIYSRICQHQPACLVAIRVSAII